MSDMLPRPEPRESFKRALRAQLMAHASTTLVRRETAWSRMQRGWLRPAVAFAAVALIVVGGAGKAAADSLPGDTAFGLKVAVEQLQLSFAIDDTTRLRILADQADHRLAELAVAIATRRVASTPLAQQAYAAAIETLTTQVDAVRAAPGTSPDKQAAVADLVDAVHLRHTAVLEQLRRATNDAQDVDRATDESDKLHVSDRPARTPDAPDRSGQPERTAPVDPSDEPDPSRTPQPTRSTRPDRTAEPSRQPQPSRSPETRSGGEDQDDHTASPTASIRR